MAYNLEEVFDPLKINGAEYAYATSNRIEFTEINSCIGIAVINNENRLLGIHLVLLDKNDDFFMPGDIQTVLSVVGNNPIQVVIVGADDCWEDNNAEAYEQLRTELGMPEVINKGDGYYGAEIVDGRINVTYRPA